MLIDHSFSVKFCDELNRLIGARLVDYEDDHLITNCFNVYTDGVGDVGYIKLCDKCVSLTLVVYLGTVTTTVEFDYFNDFISLIATEINKFADNFRKVINGRC